MFECFKSKLARLHKSFTIWFNGLAGAAVLGLPEAKDAFPQIQPYIDATLFKYAMAVLIIGNIMLRFKTGKALNEK